MASVILCADPEKVVLDLLQPARRADLELWSAGWVERNRAGYWTPGPRGSGPRVLLTSILLVYEGALSGIGWLAGEPSHTNNAWRR